jgi:hypothetical protein
MQSTGKSAHIGGSAVTVGIGILTIIPASRPEWLPHLSAWDALGFAVIGVILILYGIVNPLVGSRSNKTPHVQPSLSASFITRIRSLDNGIVSHELGVTNLGVTDSLQAQIVALGNGNTPVQMAPQTLKWAGGVDRLRMIPAGTTEYLEIAQLEHSPSNGITNEAGTQSRGIVSVNVGWNHFGYLGSFSYWEAEDFQTHIWSLSVQVSSLASEAPARQGVRLHLFGMSADDPSGKLTRLGAPTLRMSLFDLPNITPHRSGDLSG